MLEPLKSVPFVSATGFYPAPMRKSPQITHPTLANYFTGTIAAVSHPSQVASRKIGARPAMPIGTVDMYGSKVTALPLVSVII